MTTNQIKDRLKVISKKLEKYESVLLEKEKLKLNISIGIIKRDIEKLQIEMFDLIEKL